MTNFIYPDPESLAQAVAEHFLTYLLEKQDMQPRISVVLAGGNTPRLSYQRIASHPLAEKINWAQVDFFWGDERCVPLDDPNSNYKMAHDTLLAPLGITQPQRYAMPVALASHNVAATEYERRLRQFFENRTSSFDWVFLGLGTNGHTASLFPNTRALEDNTHWVLPHPG